MRLCDDASLAGKKKAFDALAAAVQSGYNHFDHADIYAAGACEKRFGEFLAANQSLRESIIITSKCGIRGHGADTGPVRYDFSKDHILDSVHNSLKRLGTDYLDILLLHRPDFLMDPEQIADAFSELHQRGVVREFGVSNFTPQQVLLLNSRVDFPLVANQVEINIHNVRSLYDGTVSQCQQLNMAVQAWCPLGGVAYAAWSNTFTKEDETRIAQELSRQAQKYNTKPWHIIVAWLLFHPAGIFPVMGSTTPQRIIDSTAAFDIAYTREDWYCLLEARNGCPVP